jgi:hypothetical protein
MPLTPFHFGPALMLGLFFYSYLDFPTLLVASVAPDIESFIGTLFRLTYSWYGWFHTLEGAIIAVILVAISMHFGKKYTQKVLLQLKLPFQKVSFKKFFLTSFVGVTIHLLLDAPLHQLIDHGYSSWLSIALTPIGLSIYGFCIVSLFVGGLMLDKRRMS